MTENSEFYVDVFKALGHNLRLKLAHRLMKRECYVNRLVEEFGVCQPVISQNLKILHNAGVVAFIKEGNMVCYEVRDERVRKILSALE